MIRPNYMFNPWKFGLMNGAADMFSGMAHGLQMQMVLNNRLASYHERYSQMADIQKAREEHNMMLAKMKMQQSALQQKSRVVTGQDGKLYKEYSHYEYDPNGNGYARVVDGREPVQTAQDKQQAVFDRMDRAAQAKTVHDDRIDARAKSRDEAKGRQQAITSANADVKSAQKELDKVNDGVESEVNKMKDEYRRKPSELTEAMTAAGLDPEDTKAKASFLKSEEDGIRGGAKKQIERAQKALDDAKSARDSLSKSDAPQIKYGPDGTPYIKGPDGKPVPYRPTADAGDGGDSSGQDQASVADNGNSGDDQSAPAPPGDVNDPMTQQYLALASDPDSFTAAQASNQDQGEQDNGLMGIEQQIQNDRAAGDAQFAQAGNYDDADQQGLMGAYG